MFALAGRRSLPIWAALLAACGTPPGSARDATADGGAPDAGPPGGGSTAPALLAGVPDVLQTTDYSCGPSSMQAVLAYYGIVATEQELIRDARTDPEWGADIEPLAATATARGLPATPVENLTLESVAGELAAGRPVIVLAQAWRDDADRPWRTDWDDGHYLVAIGLDSENVYFEDSVLENTRGFVGRAEFVDRWHCWDTGGAKAWGQAILFHAPPRPPPVPAPAEKLEPVE